jgi:hypothetical protein
MAVTGVKGKAEVVKVGGGVEDRYAYSAGGVDTIYAGDLIRINSSGEIDLAEAASAGAVHGIALEANAASAAVLPVFLFADDTVVSIPTIDGVEPEELTKSASYTLEVTTANVQAVTSTTTNGIATVVDYADTGIPWVDRYGSFDQDSGTDNNRVHVRFKQTVLDGFAAAAS